MSKSKNKRAKEKSFSEFKDEILKEASKVLDKHYKKCDDLWKLLDNEDNKLFRKLYYSRGEELDKFLSDLIKCAYEVRNTNNRNELCSRFYNMTYCYALNGQYKPQKTIKNQQ